MDGMKAPVLLDDLFGRIGARVVSAVLCVLAVLATGAPSQTAVQVRQGSTADPVRNTPIYPMDKL